MSRAVHLERVKLALGIDVGTYGVRVCYISFPDKPAQGRVSLEPQILPSSFGSTDDGIVFRSIVSFSESQDDVALVGKEISGENVGVRVDFLKHLIGRNANDSETVALCQLLNLSFEPSVSCSTDLGSPAGTFGVRLSSGRFYSFENLVSMLVREIIAVAKPFVLEKHFGADWREKACLSESIDVCLSVPAYFDDVRRRALKNAFLRVEFVNVLRVMSASTCATMAYGIDRLNSGHVVVIDVGAVSLRVAVLKLDEGICEYLATVSSLHVENPFLCGGMIFTTALVNLVANDIKKRYQLDELTSDQLRRLRTHCEKAKRDLSTDSRAKISIPNFPRSGEVFVTQISRLRFERACAGHFYEIPRLLALALDGAALKCYAINHVVLVGGSCKIPKVREIISNFFDGDEKLNHAISPGDVVALGLGNLLAQFTGPPVELLFCDCLSLSLGVVVDHFPFEDAIVTRIVSRNTVIPCELVKSIRIPDVGQDCLSVGFHEGERARAGECTLIGALTLPLFAHSHQGQNRPTMWIVECTVKVCAENTVTLAVRVLCSSRPLDCVASGTVSVGANRLLRYPDLALYIHESNRFAKEDEIIRSQASRARLLSSCLSFVAQAKTVAGVSDFQRGILMAACVSCSGWLEEHPEESEDEYVVKLIELYDAALETIFSEVEQRS